MFKRIFRKKIYSKLQDEYTDIQFVSDNLIFKSFISFIYSSAWIVMGRRICLIVTAKIEKFKMPTMEVMEFIEK